MLALEDPPSVDANLCIRLTDIRSVAQQPAGRHKIAILEDCGYCVLCRQGRELRTMAGEKAVSTNDESPNTHGFQSVKCRNEFRDIACFQHMFA